MTMPRKVNSVRGSALGCGVVVTSIVRYGWNRPFLAFPRLVEKKRPQQLPCDSSNLSWLYPLSQREEDALDTQITRRTFPPAHAAPSLRPETRSARAARSRY